MADAAPPRRPIVLTLCAALALAACSSGPGPLPKPPNVPPLATTTTGVDYSAIALRGIANRTATTIAFGPGLATLSGTVSAPDGVVDQASVSIERLVGDGAVSVTIQSDAAGNWSLPLIKGGRYRLRAWRSPDLALTKPTVLFLGASESKTLDLRVTHFGGFAVQSSVAPNPPMTTSSTSLVVLVTERTVDEVGVVRATPVRGVRVELIGSGWRAETSNPTSTDGSGEADWTLRCRAAGHEALAVSLGSGDTMPLDVPDCVTPEETTTTSTTLDPFATTTTVPRTTTTRRGP